MLRAGSDPTGGTIPNLCFSQDVIMNSVLKTSIEGHTGDSNEYSC